MTGTSTVDNTRDSRIANCLISADNGVPELKRCDALGGYHGRQSANERTGE